jgi:Druantia protein DruA
MDCVLRYRGKDITMAEVEFIRGLIAAHPQLSRRRLSTQLCKAWEWRQANGQLRTMVCRGLMLQLHRRGLIELPPPRRLMPNPLAQRSKPAPLPDLARDPVEGSVQELGPLDIRQVRRQPEEKLFNSLLAECHYLGYTQPVGEHLKHLVYARGRPIACLTWSSAPRHSGPRDRFIGWAQERRRQNIHLLAYNSRFLIMPWVNVPGLASHLLSRLARRISEDWRRLYHHPIYLLETFIDPDRFGGTSYRAANWIYLGLTTGRGKDDLSHQANRSLKQLWVYPLVSDFRTQLNQEYQAVPQAADAQRMLDLFGAAQEPAPRAGCP